MNKLFNNFKATSILAFSFFAAYLLSFIFEGQVLYSLLEYFHTGIDLYIAITIIMHFAGLFTCGFFVRSPRMVKCIMIGGMFLCLFLTIPFFFMPSIVWIISLVFSGYASGCVVGAWGYFLKVYSPKNERIKSCADVLILSNLMMIAINIVAINFSPFFGLALSVVCLIIGIIFTFKLPAKESYRWNEDSAKEPSGDLKKPMGMLFLFISVITINSGLMYQVINPTFEHLTGIVSWYWAIPYIVALLVVRNLPARIKRSSILYVGMFMIMAAFLCFMVLGRKTADYLIVNTLLLGACGILDLFWWSIISEMLDYGKNPVKIFGIGLSANVFGILLGGVLGLTITSIELSQPEVTVIALTVISISLIMLPALNRELLLLLKSHAYLSAYKVMKQEKKISTINKIKTLDPLTNREQEVLSHILLGKSNKAIAKALFISENTVKTHARNIYSKYDIRNRAELISTLLKNQEK